MKEIGADFQRMDRITLILNLQAAIDQELQLRQLIAKWFPSTFRIVPFHHERHFLAFTRFL